MNKIGILVLSIGVVFASLIVVSCDGSNDKGTNRDETQAFDGGVESTRMAKLPEVTQDLRVKSTEFSLKNEEAPVPPQCYTKTEGVNNPCYTCHQRYNDRDTVYRSNKLDDGGIQGAYAFSEIGINNQWKNLFTDKSEWVAEVSDETILNYINQDNYSALKSSLEESGWEGFIPDLENFENAGSAFDQQGFALDGSAWVAFNYKPLPSTFWPTNGSTDDVVIRLPRAFRTIDGEYNQDVYMANLSLVELNLKQLEQIEVDKLDENILQKDINGDHIYSSDVNTLNAQSHYFGDAADHSIVPQQFPVGTEFMHSVRYVGVDENSNIVVPKRMKELRYMKKIKELSESELDTRYATERKEKLMEDLPSYVNRGDLGLSNGLGWLISGFIEDYDGSLRPQKFEEQMFCMGCHSAIGTTVDSTFSFVRKVTGPKGWKYIDLNGMQDAPSVTQTEGEILQYLRRAGGGNEFRENTEMLEKWYNADGSVNTEKVLAADVYELITPSVQRALELNKAYSFIVRHQSFIHGRDANTLPANNVYHEIDESIAPLEPEHRLFGWDMRLNWN